MQPSTKYSIGDIIYNSIDDIYYLITGIHPSKWDTNNFAYGVMTLNVIPTAEHKFVIQRVDNLEHYTKVA